MILVDTSVWIDGFGGRSQVARLLSERIATKAIVVHPFVLGEISLGRWGAERDAMLSSMAVMPRVPVVPDGDVLDLIERRGLAGSGIGWVDAHLVAAALAASCELWTFDQRLARVAAKLGVDATA